MKKPGIDPLRPRRVWRSRPAIVFLAAIAAVPAAGQSTSGQQGAAPTAEKPAPDHYYSPLPQEMGTSGLKLALRKLQTTARLMQVDAHPDDEDGGMLTLEVRGKGVDTLLMTLTRGEGGQNKLGSNLFDGLGVLRTLEVLASDRYYGVEQRFSSVADFGYSKTPEETFQKWQGHEIALGDMVRVVRTFRPDVLIARFSGTERDGHGHHQASAKLTVEAFRAAADPNRFPEQIQQGLQPWQPKKLYVGNVCGFFSSTCDAANYTVRMNTGVKDPVLGTSYVQFAMRGLRHQLSQGAANWTIDDGDRFTHYKLVDSIVDSPKDKDEHEQSFFDGIDTTLPALTARLGDEEKKVPWLRAELASVSEQIDRASKAAESDPANAADPLLKAAQTLDSAMDRLMKAGLSPAATQSVLPVLESKQRQAQLAANLALGVSLEATVSSGSDRGKTAPRKDALTVVSPGQAFQVMAKLHNGSDHSLLVSNAVLDAPAGWVRKSDAGEMTVAPGQDYYANFALRVPADAASTRPYWHRNDPETEALNTIDENAYRTLPFPPSPLRVRLQYEPVEGRKRSPVPDVIRGRRTETEPQSGAISARVFVPFTDDDGTRAKTPLAVAPVYSVSLDPGEQVLPASDDKAIEARMAVTSNLSGAPAGTLRLDLPPGWKSEPAQIPVALAHRGDSQEFTFKLSPGSLREGRVEVRALLDAGGKTYSEGYSLMTREDLGTAYYYQPAAQRVSIVDVKVPKDLKVGYIMGAGDDIPTVLKQIGINVTLIPAPHLAIEDLGKYSTIVLGIRAYDTQKDVIENNKRLLDYVEAGGRLLVQYNTLGFSPSPGDFNAGKYTPYPATLSRARVSVEEAPVTILDPSNDIFHYPNEITAKDFDGWVQERGLYFMSKWDDKFTPLLECHDPGEKEQKGGLLLAHYGKGIYVYTGVAFFRQLPAGVPGAVRLFVNLVSSR